MKGKEEIGVIKSIRKIGFVSVFSCLYRKDRIIVENMLRFCFLTL